MISSAAKRSILRWIHFVVTIPIPGYIYEPASEVQQYVGGVRFIFVPEQDLGSGSMKAVRVWWSLGQTIQGKELQDELRWHRHSQALQCACRSSR
jgi:hypothetical protein